MVKKRSTTYDLIHSLQYTLHIWAIQVCTIKIRHFDDKGIVKLAILKHNIFFKTKPYYRFYSHISREILDVFKTFFTNSTIYAGDKKLKMKIHGIHFISLLYAFFSQIVSLIFFYLDTILDIFFKFDLYASIYGS